MFFLAGLIMRAIRRMRGIPEPTAGPLPGEVGSKEWIEEVYRDLHPPGHDDIPARF